mgnify:CR=1 FL=1
MIEDFGNLFHGFAVALQPFNIGVMLLGIVLGVDRKSTRLNSSHRT